MRFSSQMTKKSKKWRCALIYMALFGVAPLASGAETRYVSDYSGLSAAIAEYNANTGVDYTIVFNGDISLDGNLPIITGNPDLVGVDSGSLTIEGNGYVLDGVNTYRGFIIDTAESGATVTADTLTFANCVAQGGNGGSGAAGAGGGMGAGAAIFAMSGEIRLSDISAVNSQAIGGNGGSVLQGSQSYGGGGGLNADGGSGVVAETGAANGGGVLVAGEGSDPTRKAGDGGVTSQYDLDSYGHYINVTTPVGGNSLDLGGGGGSTAIGGNGGLGGGGGAGAQQGGVGGFGAGGGGGDSELTAGLGGFGAGNGGYVQTVTSEIFSDTQGGGTGGGGAALGAAIFVNSEANVTIVVTEGMLEEVSGSSLTAGLGGGGTAENGEAIGNGIFLLNDTTIEVAKDATYVISDSIGGYAGSSKVAPDKNGVYENMSGIKKTGEGTLVLNAADSTYAGETILAGGKIVANAEGAISSYSNLNVEKGRLELNSDQSVKNLSGGTEGVVDLGGNVLTVTGDDEAVYAGVISGDGLLVKSGKGVLALAGNSNDTEADDHGTFNTELRNGTIKVMNDGALGSGTVFYTRTDANDQTAALDFQDGVTLDNTIVLSRNTETMKLSGGSATLNGQITTNASSANQIELNLNSGSTLTVTNTGVSTDEDGVSAYNGLGNAVYAYKLVTGNLAAQVESFSTTSGDDTLRYWYNAIGNATITNEGDNSLTFTLKTDNPDDGLVFSNTLNLQSDWLTINQVLDSETGNQIDKLEYRGTTSGDGGLRIDIGDGATMYVTGAFNHASTEVASGTLDISNVSGSAVALGALSAQKNGVVYSGSKDIIINFDDDDVTFDGTITADDPGATIYKQGTGSWTMNLAGDSNIESVQIQEGTFSLGENHFDGGLFPANDFAIVIWSQGAFKHQTENGALLELDNLDASTYGGAIIVGEKDELALTSNNTSTDIAANLYGDGWIYLENVTDADSNVKPWVLSGDNSDWHGTIAVFDNYGELTLNGARSGGASDSSINFGAHNVLNVKATTSAGAIDFDNNLTINIDSGKSLDITGLSSNSHWLNDSVLTIDGGGSLVLANGSGATYYGKTLVDNGSSLVLVGDNTVDTEYGASRMETTLTNGGTIVMDYTGEGSDGKWDSLWGSDIIIDGEGGITVNDKTKTISTDGGLTYTTYNGTVTFDDQIKFVGDDNQLTFSTNGSTVELRSAIEGVGDLVKNGNGTLILDGSDAFAKATLNAGTLQLGSSEATPNTQLASSAVVVNGGVLTGWADTFGSMSVNNGTVKLLNPGKVTLTDSDVAFSMNGGSIYVNVQDKDNYTQFVAADDNAKVEMNSGSIYVDTATSGVELDNGSTLTVVQTGAGNLTGTPANFLLYDDIAGKRFVIDYSAWANGQFNLILKESSFSDLATTDNERAVASYIDSWLDSSTMDSELSDFFAALENAASANPHTLNQLTGEVRFSALNAQVHSHNLMRQTLTQNVTPLSTAGVYPCGAQRSAIRGQSWQYADKGGPSGFNGWFSAFGASGEADDYKGRSGFDYQLLGGMGGVEIGSDAENQFGFYFSYDNMRVDANNALGRVDLDEERFGLYLRLSDDWGYTFATGAIGISNYDLNRAIALGNYPTLRYSGSTDGWSGSAYLERGFTLLLPESNLQPYGGLQYTHLTADGFTEGGNFRALRLTGGDMEYDSLEGVLGARWIKSTLIGARQFDVNAYANWTHEFLDANATGDVAMVGSSNGSFRVIGNGVGRDWIYAGVGGKLNVTDVFSVFGGADVQWNDYTTYVNGHAGMKFMW
ncbi:MAG: autotransporter domain-containing protein [Planctomycetia bacterium]|nr:autotransporter domain-containing protein [Planctomycetia bacterium]